MATTYIHPQAQKFIIKQKSLGYTPRGKDVLCAHGFGLRLYGGVIIDDVIYLDLSTKVQFCYPVIGTNKLSQGVDFIRLTTLPAVNWITSTTAIFNNDGSFDLNNPATSLAPRQQYVKTDFTPAANQTSYHVAYYSATNSPATKVVEIGNSNGATQNFAFGIYQNLLLDSGLLPTAVGNLYSGPSSTANGSLFNQSLGFFILNRVNNTTIEFSQEGTSLAETRTSNSISTTPGVVWIGKDANTVWKYSDRTCEGVAGGLDLTSDEKHSEYKSFLFLHNNK